MEELRDQFLGNAYQVIVSDKLTGYISIDLLLSRIRARTGFSYHRDDAESILRGCVRNRGQAGLSLLSIRWTIAI